MEPVIVKVLSSYYITHDVKSFKLEKPKGFRFIPGQAADISINMEEWKDEKHPFTFTGLNDWDYLEFTIKIYNDHNGVTNMLGKIDEGDELIINDVFGAIQYAGPGVFIAGGAGVTPFIAIFRELYKRGEIAGNKLIFSNKTSSDVILRDELERMLGSDFINIYTRENNPGFIRKRINRDYLIEHISNFNQDFYVCGTDDFVSDINKVLLDLGAKPETLIFEK